MHLDVLNGASHYSGAVHFFLILSFRLPNLFQSALNFADSFFSGLQSSVHAIS